MSSLVRGLITDGAGGYNVRMCPLILRGGGRKLVCGCGVHLGVWLFGYNFRVGCI